MHSDISDLRTLDLIPKWQRRQQDPVYTSYFDSGGCVRAIDTPPCVTGFEAIEFLIRASARLYPLLHTDGPTYVARMVGSDMWGTSQYHMKYSIANVPQVGPDALKIRYHMKMGQLNREAMHLARGTRLNVTLNDSLLVLGQWYNNSFEFLLQNPVVSEAVPVTILAET